MDLYFSAKQNPIKWSLHVLPSNCFGSLIFYIISTGAADYPCFRGLLKQLGGPLSTQLSDRRSSIVKQV